MQLPSLLNLNPRSLYNKKEEFVLLVDNLNPGVVFISESWEREEQLLEELLVIPDYKIISNPKVRPVETRGGRPALMINTRQYAAQAISEEEVKIPQDVEIIWVLLTPKNNMFPIKKILLASIYSKPNSRKKTIQWNNVHPQNAK